MEQPMALQLLISHPALSLLSPAHTKSSLPPPLSLKIKKRKKKGERNRKENFHFCIKEKEKGGP